MALQHKNIQLRNMLEEDVPLLIQYWYGSEGSFLEGMGVDPKKLPEPNKMRKNFIQKCKEIQEGVPSRYLSIVDQQQCIGLHVINQLEEGKTGVFHAHIFQNNMRNKGVCRFTYPRACNIFMQRFALQTILFKTPALNHGALALKNKMHVQYVGEEISQDYGPLKDGLCLKIFSIDQAGINRSIQPIP